MVASNRGPVSFDRDDRGRLSPRRGTGGLVTALSGVFYRDDTAWVSAAMTDGDRAVALKGRTVTSDSHQRMRYVVIPPERYDGYYNEVSNRILWMVHHNLWDIPARRCSTTARRTRGTTSSMRTGAFAEALAQEADNDPVYLIQDYHLCLVPGMLRELCPRRRSCTLPHLVRGRHLPQGVARDDAHRAPARHGRGGRARLPVEAVGRELPAVGA